MSAPAERAHPPGTAGPARSIQLDALRGLAVMAVLWHHAGVPLHLGWPWRKLDAGHLGVVLFFVLSGFLITGMLLADRERSAAGAGRLQLAGRFYARRLLRLAPIYYLTLLALWAADFEASRERWLWLATYTINLYAAWHSAWPGYVAHFWSLAVEQQFYLLWPWLVLWLPGRSLQGALWLAVLLGPLTRALALLLLPHDLRAGGYTSVALPSACFDSLGAGALLAWYTRLHPEATARVGRRIVLPIAVAVALALLSMESGNVWFVLGDTPVSAALAILVGSAATGFKGVLGSALRARPLAWLGRVSYGVYLFHLPLLGVLLAASAGSALDLRQHGGLRFAACAIPSLLLAALSFHGFEEPLRQLFMQFVPRQARRPGPLRTKGELRPQRQHTGCS
jgi:peptidoglycan/LPS O-acetylase OafA/YrhL